MRHPARQSPQNIRTPIHNQMRRNWSGSCRCATNCRCPPWSHHIQKQDWPWLEVCSCLALTTRFREFKMRAIEADFSKSTVLVVDDDATFRGTLAEAVHAW